MATVSASIVPPTCRSRTTISTIAPFPRVRNNGGKDFLAARNRCSKLGERGNVTRNSTSRTPSSRTISSPPLRPEISLTNFAKVRNVGCGGPRSRQRDLAVWSTKRLIPTGHRIPPATAAKVGVEAEGDILVEGNRIRGPLTDRNRMRVRQGRCGR